MFLFQGLFCKMRTDWSTTVLPSASHCCWPPSAGLSAHFCPCRSWMLSFIFAAAFGTRVLSSNIEPVFCQDMQINYMQISEQCGSCTNFLSLCESLRPIPRFAASKTTTVRYQNGSCLSHFLNLYDLTKRSHE